MSGSLSGWSAASRRRGNAPLAGVGAAEVPAALWLVALPPPPEGRRQSNDQRQGSSRLP
jgi:hypothetical protein